MKFKHYRHEYIEIMRLGLPILVGQLGMIVVGFADNIMIGRYSTDSLASASFVNNVFNMAILCVMGFSYGLTPLVGSLFGRGEHEKIGSTVAIALRVNIIFNLIITALMTVMYFFLDHLGQPAQLMPLIKPYYLIYLVSMLPITVFNVFAQWSYGINNTGMPMWVILGANLLNVCGNWLLIYGHCGMPELGLIGAGISTLTARVLSAVVIVMFFAYSRAGAPYRHTFTHSVVDRRTTVKRVWHTSVPVALQMTFETGSFTIAAVMAGWLGAIELASFQIIVIVGTLGFCIYYAIGGAVSVKVSNRSADAAHMRRTAWAGYHLLLAFMVVSSTVFLLFGRTLMGIFTTDPAVIAMSASLLFPLVLYQFGDATQINFANALRGTSRVMSMLWVSFVSYIVIGVPVCYYLGFTAGLGLYGIVLSFTVSLLLAAMGYLFFFLKNTRK